MGTMSSMERIALVIAAIFVIAGLSAILFPWEGRIYHSSDTGGLLSSPSPISEKLTVTSCRVYGAVTMGAGILLGWIAWSRKKD